MSARLFYAEMNFQQARQLLAEAGYPNGQNFPKLTLTFNLSEGQMYLAAAIQEMWKKVLNIHIELVTLEWKVYLKYRREKNFEIARGGWIGDYNDPTTFLDLWLHDSPNNYTNWQNAKFDDLLAQAAQEPHAAKRMHLLEEAENILLVQRFPDFWQWLIERVVKWLTLVGLVCIVVAKEID